VSYEIRIKPSAVKELRALPDEVRARVVDRIRALAEEPRPWGCEKLTGGPRYRVRQGAYRVVYQVDDAAREVLVVKIGHRRDVYR